MKAEDLRKSILQAAVEGKLVTQDKNDEPASELLKRIEHEKACLDKEGKLKRTKPLPPITDDETPYDLPDGWVWCRLGFIGDVRGGKRIPKGMSFSKYPTAHIYIRVTDMKNGTISDQNICYIGEDVFQQISRYTISKDDVYITIAGTIGDCGTVPAKFDGMNLTENAAKLSIFGAYKDYIVKAIASPLVQAQFTEKTNQMAQPKLALERIKSTIIPYPPIAEQQRIVAKVDELMALCDKLETAETELNVLEDHLTEDLPKSILQAAVQGKLVPQDKSDEPASELLGRIHAEKIALIRSGKINKEKPLPPITGHEIPYDLPNGWVWCRLGDIIQLISGRDLAPSEYNDQNKGIPYITGASAITDENINITRWTEHPAVISHYSDIFITCKGTIGKIVKNTIGDCHIARQIMAIRIHSSDLNNDYLSIALRTFVPQLVIQAKSIIPGISRSNLLYLKFPLPPFAEQQRIVEKIEELMDLCDQLKYVGDTPINYSDIIPFSAHTTETEPLQMVAQGKVTKTQSVKHQAALRDLKKMMDNE
jgi:type I restriction enzyme S subunit